MIFKISQSRIFSEFLPVKQEGEQRLVFIKKNYFKENKLFSCFLFFNWTDVGLILVLFQLTYLPYKNINSHLRPPILTNWECAQSLISLILRRLAPEFVIQFLFHFPLDESISNVSRVLMTFLLWYFGEPKLYIDLDLGTINRVNSIGLFLN